MQTHNRRPCCNHLLGSHVVIFGFLLRHAGLQQHAQPLLPLLGSRPWQQRVCFHGDGPLAGRPGPRQLLRAQDGRGWAQRRVQQDREARIRVVATAGRLHPPWRHRDWAAPLAGSRVCQHLCGSPSAALHLDLHGHRLVQQGQAAGDPLRGRQGRSRERARWAWLA